MPSLPGRPLRPSRRPAAELLLALATTAALVAGCGGEARRADGGPTAPLGPEPAPVTARWSDPRSWPDGVVPTGGDVTIPDSTAILLDVSPPALGTLTVRGTLEFDRKDLTLVARRVQVHGTLRVGTEGRPFLQRATIQLTGTAEEQAAFGLTAKALAVLDGGTAELHGAPRTGWLRLAATAPAGATQLVLERAPDWRAGDRLVVSATDFDPAQYDEVTVAAVQGATVTLAAPLRFRHHGERLSVAGRTVDERGEVGLLSRNVVFRGDDACAATGFCAHLIGMRGGTLRVEGTELYLVGQKARLARYPIHWHVAQDVAGQYARRNSIWRSFNRCVTVHGSHAATVEGNVCHDHLGHGYFLEDGVETRNTIAGNLGVFGRAPVEAERVLPSDRTPASFWITNPANEVRGNVAAGAQGWGFWYALPEHPTGMSATDAVWPRRTPLGAFVDNVAHSNRSGGLNVDDGPRADGVTEVTWYAPRADPAADSPVVPAAFTNFAAWKHRGRAVWLRGRAHRLVNPTLADNQIGATFASSDTYLEGGLVAGQTANDATPFAAGFPVRGFEFYDGTVGVDGTTFANLQPSARGPASALGFNRRNAFSLSTQNFAAGARLVNASAVYLEDPAPDKDGDKAAVFLDRDGSVTGAAGRYVAANVPLLVTPACAARPEWNAHVCPLAYGRLDVTSAATGELVAPATVTRDDGVALALAGSGNRTTSISLSVPLARAYAAATATTLTRPRVTVWGVKPGEWVRVSLPFAATGVTAWRDYWTGNRVTAAASLAELDASAGDRYFLAGGVLHLKLVAQAGRDYAAVFVDPQ
jgi:cell migration-inducing and hyaluronan-binding protein